MTDHTDPLTEACRRYAALLDSIDLTVVVDYLTEVGERVTDRQMPEPLRYLRLVAAHEQAEREARTRLRPPDVL